MHASVRVWRWRERERERGGSVFVFERAVGREAARECDCVCERAIRRKDFNA